MRDIKTREGFEFWDKLNALPRYAFLLSASGNSVQKFEDKGMGNWIDVHEAQKVVDQAQDRINELSDELTGNGGVDFGIDDRSVRVSQEAYSIFLAREAAGRERIAALQLLLNERDEQVHSLEQRRQAEQQACTAAEREAARYRLLRKVTPYRFKKMQDAATTDGGDEIYFHADRFDAAIDALLNK